MHRSVALWRPLLTFAIGLLAAIALSSCKSMNNTERIGDPEVYKWGVHDESRPLPPVIEPGTASTQSMAGQAPSDAVILFDGRDLSRWEDEKGNPAAWKVSNGYMEVVPKAGAIRTKQGFGDVQLHVEWSAPTEIVGESQGRGNSGIFLMDTYEIQVLDVYQNKTYADGHAGAVYGQYPPLVNAVRAPGQWNMYDIVFKAPRFDNGGRLLTPAAVTVFVNGVVAQNNVILTGPTAWKQRPPYKAHAQQLPISLQDHGNPVRYRNIWVREL